MPRYHFNIYDGYTVKDTTGTELPDLTHARQEAVRRSGEILERDASRLKLGQDWTMEVTNKMGGPLFRLCFTVAEVSPD